MLSLPTRALLLLVLGGCTVQEPEVCDGDPVVRDDGDLDGYLARDDCDDADFDIHPSAQEMCDGQDNDCDGLTDDDDDVADAIVWFQDIDGDGYGRGDVSVSACEAPAGYVADAGDCDDAESAVNPGAAEMCDGLDNDCEGTTDEGAVDAQTYYTDADGDTFGDPDSEAMACDVPLDAVDNGQDCDDDDAMVNPLAAEMCDDVDNDCDGEMDESSALDAAPWYEDADGDSYGTAAVSVAACDQPAGYSDSPLDCDDAQAAVNPGAAEICDEMDNDCDFLVDDADSDLTDAGTWYADADGDSYGTALVSVSQCDQPTGFVANGDDCDDLSSDVNPGETEVCDEMDNDCDGDTDGASAVDAATWYPDDDADGYGAVVGAIVACDEPDGYADNNADCDDGSDAVNPDAAESCDGLDNNCNASADEGFNGDLDEDGVLDCVDGDCEVVSPSAGAADLSEDCEAPATSVTDPWDVRVEWQITEPDENLRDTSSVPLVGHLVDGDEDGDVDTDDVPSVVYVSADGYLVVVDGGTGEVSWSMGGFYADGGLALADVDADGTTDIVAYTSLLMPVAISGEGEVLWTSLSIETGSDGYPTPIVADVDGDGAPEVISNSLLLDGETGALEAVFAYNTDIRYYIPAVGDLDLDGEMEIIIGDTVYAPDGTVEWTGAVEGDYGHWSVLVDYDGDAEGEVMMLGGGRMVIYDHDGAELHTVTSENLERPGVPCVADFDGDGEGEIAWAAEDDEGTTVLGVYELDGKVVWTDASVFDTSGLAGCSGYDIDNDGSVELLYADQQTFYIFDGADGTVRYQNEGHASVTVFEYPTVADVDGDGSAEILLTSNTWEEGWGVLTAFGHGGDGWLQSGTTWPVHDFTGANIGVDGSVPTDPDPVWQSGFYRGRAAVEAARGDLEITLADSCASSCDDAGVVELAVQVSNVGAADIGEDITLAVYTDDGVTRTLLQTQTMAGGLASGEAGEGVVFTISLADLSLSDTLVVVADDSGAGGSFIECDESNNSIAWSDLTCSEITE